MSKDSKHYDDDFDNQSPDTYVDSSAGDIDDLSLEESDGNFSTEEDSDLRDINDEYADLATGADEDIDSDELSEKEHYLEDIAEDGDVDEEGLEGSVKSLDFDEDQPLPYGYDKDPNGYEDDED